MKFFNTAGPIVPQDHYNIPVTKRIDIDEIMTLIQQKKYFVLHAPRQTGKTSTLLALMKLLNESGKYKCLYVNVEGAQTTRNNVEAANRAILRSMTQNERHYLKEDFLDNIVRTEIAASPHNAIEGTLKSWASQSTLPIVLLIDEIDSLVGDSLVAVLRQLRAGYESRPSGFPQSIMLCGVRDIRDYRIHLESKEIITGGSCFNINAESLKVGSFSLEEVKNLYGQHTADTGQPFTSEAVNLAYNYTKGQPWLINAIGYETCFKMEEGQNRAHAITENMVRDAAERLIQRRVTHLDQLVDKLKEDRVRGIIEPIIRGVALSEVPTDDLLYTIDLGLVVREKDGIKIANPIYQEVIPRELGYMAQTSMESIYQPKWYVKDTGGLDSEKLVTDFQQFFRENSESWVESFNYKEAGPQLLLQAFLQRVVNGGGRIFREYGLGRMRTDLLVEWRDESKVVFELKVVHKTLEKTIEEGLEQTHSYMDRVGGDIAHLLVFDRSKEKSWDQKIFREERLHNGKKIVVWGM